MDTTKQLQRKSKMKNPVNKYYAKKVYDEVYGMFDSQKEYLEFQKLVLLQRAGEISNLKRQVRYELIEKNDKFGNCLYIADYYYIDKYGEQHVIDCKGYKKGAAYELYKIKRKLMFSKFGIYVEEI
jgi:hypothetical protein